MKSRCYPKYTYISFIILAVLMFIFSFAPMFIKTGEKNIIVIIWSASMFLLAITFIVGAIQYMQWYYFEDNYIIVRSLFGTIIKLNMEKAQAYIETLPTSFSWATVIDERWICIYDENIINNFMHRFKSGCSNDKKHKRIQIIFNQNNIENISQRLKINKRQIF